MSGQLVADDLPDDVEGAESLLTTHAEHKVEIDARGAQFEAFRRDGESLIKAHHYASSEVRGQHYFNSSSRYPSHPHTLTDS